MARKGQQTGMKFYRVIPIYDQCIFCEKPACDVVVEIDGMRGGVHLDCAVKSGALEETEVGAIEKVKRELEAERLGARWTT